jgi:hypothetical protein
MSTSLPATAHQNCPTLPHEGGGGMRTSLPATAHQNCPALPHKVGGDKERRWRDCHGNEHAGCRHPRTLVIPFACCFFVDGCPRAQSCWTEVPQKGEKGPRGKRGSICSNFFGGRGSRFAITGALRLVDPKEQEATFDACLRRGRPTSRALSSAPDPVLRRFPTPSPTQSRSNCLALARTYPFSARAMGRLSFTRTALASNRAFDGGARRQ